MNKVHQFKKELSMSHPVALLSISLLAIIIMLLAITVVLFSYPTIQTVTSYEDCVNVGGKSNHRTCEINEQSFSAPLKVKTPNLDEAI